MLPSTTLVDVRGQVLRRLNDDGQAFWTFGEVDRYLTQAYQALTRATRAIWDLAYLENLPRGFSMTAAWERDYAEFDFGVANYTMDDERREFDPEYAADGPANYTSPFEATGGHLEAIGASTAIPALATVPADLTEIDRPTYDDRAISVISRRDAEAYDSRFELTEGPVDALVTKGDGLRVVRKVRVPSQQAETYTIAGSWGLLRKPTDLTGATVTGTWGVPRRIPDFHPMGPETFGIPRRPYSDVTNVRLEHWREGRSVTVGTDVFELPDRATVYLRDYAIGRCYGRSGPAQDLTLAAHYEARYQRGVARLQRRVQAQQRQRIGVMGGSGTARRTGPPRPTLPWAFGKVVRG
jgi:hypothetical protein